MTDLKISQFSDGGSIQSTDSVAVVRSGVNTKVTVGSSASLDAGNTIGDVLLIEDVDGNAGLPAIDGSQLTGLASGVSKPSGGVWVAIGDSITQNSIGASTAGTNGYNTYYHQRGYINWFQCKTGYPYSHIPHYLGQTTPIFGHNVAIGGEETKDMLARFTKDVLSLKPNIVSIMAGTNDIKAGVSAESIFSNIKQMAHLSIDSGAYVLIFTILPRNDSDGNEFTSGEEVIRLAVNSLLVNLGQSWSECLHVIECDAFMIDGTTGMLDEEYAYDGLHINSKGGWIISEQGIIPWWQNVADTERIPRKTPSDYNVTTNPFGNILTNSVFSGTGGTLSTGSSGTLPDNWRAERSSGSTITTTFSIVSQSDWNGNTANFISGVYSSPGTGVDPESFRIRTSATITTPLVTNTWYIAEVEVIMSAASGTNPIRSVYLETRDQTGDDSIVRCFSTAYTNGSVKDIFPETEERFILRTPPLLIDGTTGVLFYMMVDMDGTVNNTRTVKWGRPTLIPMINQPEIVDCSIIEKNTSVAASPNLIDPFEVNKIFTNEGATALNVHTLPTGLTLLGQQYTFIVQDSDGIKVNAASGSTIRIGGSVSASGGYIQSTTVGSTVTITNINPTEWVALYSTGTWTVT